MAALEDFTRSSQLCPFALSVQTLETNGSCGNAWIGVGGRLSGLSELSLDRPDYSGCQPKHPLGISWLHLPLAC
jgi:hypothetical protein